MSTAKWTAKEILDKLVELYPTLLDPDSDELDVNEFISDFCTYLDKWGGK
jgi:acetone carboxylase gamma subunit